MVNVSTKAHESKFDMIANYYHGYNDITYALSSFNDIMIDYDSDLHILQKID